MTSPARPLTENEVARLSNFTLVADGTSAERILATIRAKDAEIAALRAEVEGLKQANQRHQQALAANDEANAGLVDSWKASSAEAVRRHNSVLEQYRKDSDALVLMRDVYKTRAEAAEARCEKMRFCLETIEWETDGRIRDLAKAALKEGEK